MDEIKARLEYLRGEIEAERISQGEIAELQGLAEHIEPGDVVLLEWAGVPEHDEREIRKTTITVTVLSNGPLAEDTGEDFNWLAYVAEAMYSGDAIGDYEVTSDEEVPHEKIKDELIAIGNDGTFFDAV